PLTMIFAPSWGWVLAANVLLGINQGLCWSMTVIMKIDLAGSKRRGMATALNEWAGYGGVALAAAGTGYLAQSHGLWPTPFFPGIGIALAGLSLSFFASETANRTGTETQGAHAGKPSFFHLFALASWKDRTLIAANQAGLITNFKDGAMWGLAPLYLAQNELNPAQIGTVTAVYPAIWGFVQLAAGPLSDQWGRKWLIFSGMLLQGFGLGFFVLSTHFWQWTAAAALLGLGTALVYPTLQAAVADRAENSWRASSLGIYRLWRDSGYVLAGAGVGIAANFFDIRLSLGIVAGLSVVSGLVISALMKETLWKDGS
ncbi:MAG: MFS transporter, partial [Desulfovibrionales bacterium]